LGGSQKSWIPKDRLLHTLDRHCQGYNVRWELVDFGGVAILVLIPDKLVQIWKYI